MKKRSHLFVTREIIEQVPQNKKEVVIVRQYSAGYIGSYLY